MNTTSDSLTRPVQDLDPARDLVADPRPAHVADAALARIMDTPRPTPGRAGQAPSGRTVRKVALVGGLAAAATAGLFVMDVVREPGPLGSTAAWAAVPSTPDASELAAFADRCRDMQNLPGDATPSYWVVEDDGTQREMTAEEVAQLPPPLMTEQQAAQAKVVIAEQRGSSAYALLEADNGATFSCLGPLAEDDAWLAGGAEVGRPALADPRGILVVSSGDSGSTDRSIASVEGHVGADVASIVLHTVAQGEVTATVEDGRFAAWWPGPEWGVTAGPGSVAATVTYADGSAQETTLELRATP